MIIVNPNVPHTEMSRDESPLEYIVLGIEGLQFTSFTNHMEYEDYSVHNYYEFKHEILFYLKTLVQEMAQQDSDPRGGMSESAGGADHQHGTQAGQRRT